MLVAAADREFDRRERYDRWECRSTAHWLNGHCGLSIPGSRVNGCGSLAPSNTCLATVALSTGGEAEPEEAAA